MTMTQNDLDLGILNIVIGFDSQKPAEFLIVMFQQTAGHFEA